MSFFKNTLASIGIGGAKVDTILHSSQVTSGDAISGVINILGGNVEQNIKRVNLFVRTNYEKESNDKKVIATANIQKHLVEVDKMVFVEERLQIPFSFKLSKNCPISTYRYKVWVATELDIEKAIDSNDCDSLNVVPSKKMQNLFNAFSELGFRSRETENIQSIFRINNLPFVQEFEFVPTSGPLYGRLDEVELIISVNESGFNLYLEVDRSGRTLGGLISEALNLDESKVKLNFSNYELENVETIKNALFSVISGNC
ncbi:sporulation protein [uncultured Clostridium sp.]|jgi:sporulation-control protein|uniref:sporulation protein n=1 Tax=uncultured Clostridium sp. TaxID=59620 RepID=UPI00262D9482|nr:sporulation protein [uncultured Clostridium sp.]